MTAITFNKVYLYDNIRQLLAVGNVICPLKDSGPMTKNPILIHKGIDNETFFRVLGPDRIPFDVACGQQVYARIINPDNRTIVLEQLCRLGPAKGLITLSLNSGDIADVAVGLYQMVLIRTEEFVNNVPGYYTERPLYSDMYDNISMEVEITEQAFKAPLDSITILPEDWTPDLIMPTVGAPIPCFYTKRIPGARILNHKESVHSFSTYTQNFTGTLELFGSLEETPDAYLSPTRWFKIYPSTMSQDIEYVGYTGTTAYTYQMNVLWVKFRLTPSTAVLDPGVMSKLIIRN